MNPSPHLPEILGIAHGHRRMVRGIRTQELTIRSRHRRKATVIRTGVLTLFGFAMIVYPIVGTLSPAASAAEKVPGVVLGQIPETIEVVMGKAPGLGEAALPLPDLVDTSHYIAISSEYVVTPYLPDCDGHTPADLSILQNGNLSDSEMCILWDGVNKVRADAAVALAELNHAFKLKFGRNMCIISSYRTIADQQRMRRERGRLAAGVGQSYHGWGLAIDLCNGDDRGEHKAWLDANGLTYGWANPSWARGYEPWHFEYTPGTALIGWASRQGSYISGTTEVPDTSIPDTAPTTTPTITPSVSPSTEPSP